MSKFPPGTWVRFNRSTSVRHGEIGQVQRDANYNVTISDWKNQRNVYFPLLCMDWSCKVKDLTLATEEEIALVNAKAALGLTNSTRWRDMHPDTWGVVPSNDD